MKRENPARHFVVPLIIALVVYTVSYSWIEHRRTRKGPWEVTFTNSAFGPAVLINQPKLGLTNIAISFAGVTNTAGGSVRFGQARPVPYELPFGKCVFMDTTFLPGTVTLDLFGHEIELLPRTLVIDRVEHPWVSNEQLALQPLSVPERGETSAKHQGVQK